MEKDLQPINPPALVSEERRIALQHAASLDGPTASHHFKVLGEQLYISVALIDGIVNLVEAVDQSGLQGIFTLIQKGDREAVDQIRKGLLERADDLLETAKDIEADGNPKATMARYEVEGRIEPKPAAEPITVEPKPMPAEEDDLLPTGKYGLPLYTTDDNGQTAAERLVLENYDMLVSSHNQKRNKGWLADKVIRLVPVLTGIELVTSEELAGDLGDNLKEMKAYVDQLNSLEAQGQPPHAKGPLEEKILWFFENEPVTYRRISKRVAQACALDAQEQSA